MLPEPVRRCSVGRLHAFEEGHGSRGLRSASLDDAPTDCSPADAELGADLPQREERIGLDNLRFGRINAQSKSQHLGLVLFELAAKQITAPFEEGDWRKFRRLR